MMKTAAILCLALAGCANRPTTTAPETAPVRPISGSAAAGCTYLDDVPGVSGWYGVFAERGLAQARAIALQQAAAKGANAIVWHAPNLGYGSTSVTGAAYRCPA